MTLNPFHGTDILYGTDLYWFSDVFQGLQKNTSAMKWVKDIFNKYVKVLIFMLVP